MRWGAFIILAYLMVGIQTGIGAFARLESSTAVIAELNFVLIAVVFIALNAPRNPALLGCVIMGLMQDLATQQALGMYAFSYGIVAVVLNGSAQTVYRSHPLTHFVCALMGGIVVAIILVIHGMIHSGAASSKLAPFSSALYSAVLAPLVISGLQRFNRMFAFQSSRRKVRPW